ncbi:hypothetical protein CCAN2_2010042 [Capnocytophaga canimorsus]|nr:hypothetical protein CCAN2_2010042 [Capnocytophaga canimorsus]
MYENGKNVARTDKKEVLLKDNLQAFLLKSYPDLEAVEVKSILNEIAYQPASNLYDSNKYICKLLADGFAFKRNNPAKKDLHIRYIDVENVENNVFKVVNQLEIQGSELRIPDIILYINGIPVVVLELKTLINEEITIYDAFKQLTIRYKRDIPELLKYNVFCVISDGVNNKAGTLFSPYEFFYGWHKITGDEPQALVGFGNHTFAYQGNVRQKTTGRYYSSFCLISRYFQKRNQNSVLLSTILCRQQIVSKYQTAPQTSRRWKRRNLFRSYGLWQEFYDALSHPIVDAFYRFFSTYHRDYFR